MKLALLFCAALLFCDAQTFTISPNPQTLQPGATVQYSTNLTPPVAWSVRPPAAGTMCPNGLYIAPNVVKASMLPNITATSSTGSVTTFAIVLPGTAPTVAVSCAPPSNTTTTGQQGTLGAVQPTYIPTASPAWLEFASQDDGTWLIDSPPIGTDGHPIAPTLVITGGLVKLAGGDFTVNVVGQGISLVLRQEATWTAPVMGLWIQIK